MKFREEKIKNEGRGKWVVTIEGEEFEKIKLKAQNRVKSKIEIPGFRKGHAPTKEVEKRLTPTRVYQEAYQVALDAAFQFALTNQKLVKPLNAPVPGLTKVNEKLMELEFTFDLVPEIKLGKYKGLETVKKVAVEVSDEEIKSELKKYQERFLMEKIREVDEPIQEGDLVIFDFEGLIEGVEFPGGAAQDYKLVIGSNQFVPGFETAMLGLKIGTGEIKVTFPENYAQNLSGKEAVFKLKIKEIHERILPKVDEELVKDLNLKGIEKIQQLKDKVKADLTDQKTQAEKARFVNAILTEIIQNSSIEIPQSAVEHQVKELKKEFEQEVIRQGLTIKDYKKATKLSDADIEKEIRGDAQTRLKTYLVTTEIQKEEKFLVPEAEIETKYQELALRFGLEIPQLKTMLPEAQIKEEVMNEMITDFLYQVNG